MRIAELAAIAHHHAKTKGFYDGVEPTLDAINTRLLLIVTEIAEAQEELRAGRDPRDVHYTGQKPEGFGTELADAVIRIADLAQWLGIDLETCVVQKHGYNVTRPHKHGGKKF